MTIRIEEKPTSRKGQVKFADPSTTLEIWVYGASDENALEAAVEGWRTETYTVNGVTRFFDSYTYQPEGSCGGWSVTLLYKKDPNSIELSADVGGGTRKMMQSKSTVRAYNCQSSSSSATGDASGTAQTDAATANDDADILESLLDAAAVAANTATAAANVGGVDPTVKSWVLSCADEILLVVQFGGFTAQATHETADACDAAAVAAVSGNAPEANSQSAAAQSNSAAAQDAAAATTAHDTAANNDWIAADAAASGGNAQTIAAAAAAAAALTFADAVEAAATTAAADAATCATDAAAVAAAAQADITAGGNGIPNFNRAVAVSNDNVEGADVPDRKFEFTVAKKLRMSTLSGGYILQLFNLLNTVNDSEYTIIYNGQTLTFARGTLMLLAFPFRMTSDVTLDISYKFSASRSILASDNFSIGSSGIITKEGWQLLWTWYKEVIDSNSHRLVKKPIATYIEKMFDYDDFSKIVL